MYAYLVFFLCLSQAFSSQSRKVRNVVNERSKVWQRGVVVYRISGVFTNGQTQIIESAMHEIEAATSFHNNPCITFAKREGNYLSNPDFLYIKNENTCSAQVGRQGGKQEIFLSDSCVTKPQVMYYLVRTLGLYNEHDRPDRDQFITVHMDNVVDAYKPEFTKMGHGSSDLLGFLYDFNSITHFGPYDYAKNKDIPTISTKVSGVSFGHKSKLSVKDVMKLQYLYNCGLDTAHIPNLPAHPIDCDFEGGLCNVADDWTDDIKWTRNRGPVSVAGPQSDHSNGNGYYVYAGNGTTGIARLLGARELQTGIYCIELFYYIVGNNSASILIYAEDFPESHNTTLLIAQTNINPTNSWNQMKHLFDHVNPWRLTIEVDVSSQSSGVAIDDLHVYGGSCPES